ncbi:tandem-95 repeat protein [Kovacikia minuta CCNUW1]|uniref:tandem-95 repeat protein n=1 Tax=Kovacikia minuta TaxID=2931930 RepID=UPI001CC93A7A|nr:tandem-95 repeat protein [Kovacikia minuta]UBF25627.1 tandem-95 repeat protein [Kovacikia minuta CCNUW1]
MTVSTLAAVQSIAGSNLLLHQLIDSGSLLEGRYRVARNRVSGEDTQQKLGNLQKKPGFCDDVLVVFDCRVPDLDVLYQALVPGAIACTLDAKTDPLEAITQWLSDTGATRLAIVAHGEPGVVQIGANPLTLAQLQAQSALLQEWGVEEISLYSCEVAKGDRGWQFVQQLSALTRAGVSAASFKVGNSILGGSWDLDVATGTITSFPTFLLEVLANYQSVLAPSNDNFANRIALNGINVSTTGTNVEATGESGELNHAGVSGDDYTITRTGTFSYRYNYGEQGNLSSVWYSWTAPTSGYTTIDTNGSSLDTTLGVYSGSSVGSLSLLASNDNWNGSSSQVSFYAVAGTTYQIAVDGYYNRTGSFALNINGNDPPVAVSDTFTVLEDSTLNVSAPGLLANDSDPDGTSPYWSYYYWPTNGTIANAQGNGSFTYTPPSNFYGSDSFQYQISDGYATSNFAPVTINVTPVNDMPFFTKGTNLTVNEDAGAQSVFYWATGISPGAYNEWNQSLTFLTSSDNTALFSVQPSISSNGTLIYTPAINAYGSATITVQLKDSGGTSNGGIDTSTAQTFTITVNSVNDAPIVVNTIASQSTTEDTFFNFTVPIDTFTDVDGDSLSYTASLSNGNALPTWLSFNPITRTFSGTPTNDNVGSLNLRVTATDTSGASASSTFDVAIANVNDAPSFTGNAPLAAIVEDTMNSAGQSIASLFTGLVTDPDAGASLKGAIIFGDPANATTQGRWQFSTTNGSSWFNVADSGSPFALSATALVRFVPVANYNGTPPGLVVRALDNTFSGNFSSGGIYYSVNTQTVGGTSPISANTATINTSVTSVNDAPTVTGTLAGQKVLQDFPFSFTVPANTFSDADLGDTLTYSATLSNGNFLPSWLTFNPTTRTFSGTPAAGDLGNLALQVIATDSTGASTSTPFALAVAVPKPGDLDPSFGGSGKVIGDVGIITSVLVQPDGKVVMSGRKQNSSTGDDFLLTRYNADGTVDGTFGSNGSVSTHVSFDEIGRSVVLQADGKLLVAGTTAGNFAVIRYNSNGAIDTSFGSNGIVTTDFGRSDEGYKVLVQPDGKVIVSGTIYNSSNNYDFGLVRYNSDGTIDTTFGTNGRVNTHIISDEYGYSAAIQSDGKVLVTGTSDGRLALVRYNPNGTLDSSFGTNGVARTNLGGINNGRDLVIQPDGKILVAGDSTSGSFSNFAVVRYNANGTIDTSFGSSGVVVTDFSNSEDYVTGIVLQANGKFVVSGFNRVNFSTADFALVRYNSNGTIDTSFGDGGKVVTDLGSDDYALDVALQTNGAIVAAGYSFSNGTAKVALARYLGDPPNQAPTNISLSNSTIAENSANGAIVGTLATTDPDASDTHTYTLLNNAGGRFALNGSQIVVADGSLLDFEAANSHTIRVRATDNNGLSVEKDVAIALTNRNEAPVVGSSLMAPFLYEDSPFSFTLPDGTFNDPEGDSLTYTATRADGAPLPDWLTFDAATRTFSGTPPQDAGMPSITVTASDGQFSTSTTFPISVVNVNDAPQLVNEIADQTIAENSSFTLLFSDYFSDPDSGLFYTATLENGDPLPDWLTFTGGSIVGTPGYSNAGTFNIKVTAADSQYAVSDVFTLTITNVNQAPVVGNAIANQTAIEDAPFSFTIPTNAFTDVDGDALAYTASLADGSGLPDWLSFNSTTGTFSGTPDDPDLSTLNIKVTATDPSGIAASQVFQVSVASTDDPTVITAPTQQTIDEDTSLIFSSATGNAITLSDVDAGNSLLQVSLMITGNSGFGGAGSFSLGDTSGLSYVSEDGRSFRGTLAAINAALEGLNYYPSGDYNGTANLQVMVSNPTTGAASSKIIPILVNPVNDAPILHLGIAPTVTEDEPFSFSFSQASDPDDRFYGTIPITYSARLADGSDLPDWISFDPSTRTFSGTPTNGNLSTLDIEVTASDGEAFSSEVFTLAITNVNDAPALTGTSANLVGTEDTTYTFTATSLLQGFTDAENDPLSITNLTATNGSLIAHGDGTYSFTPNANFNGTVNLNYQVSDGKGGVTAASQHLAIAAVNDPVTGTPTAILTSGTEDTAYTITAARLLQGFSDVDITTSGQILSIANLTANHGSLTLNPDGSSWTLTPTANFNGMLTLTYEVTDNNGSSLIGQTRSFNLAAANDAPVAVGNATLAAVNEDTLAPGGATVSSLFAGTFSDAADQVTGGTNANSFAGIALVANSASAAQGVWQYSSNNGSSWVNLPPNLTNSNAFSLAPTTLLRFRPNANFSGTPGTLSARLIENTTSITNAAIINVSTNGGSSAYSANTVELTTTITPINDAPTLNSIGVRPLTAINEDSTINPGTLVSTFLGTSIVDADAGALRGIAVTGLTGDSNGTWQYSNNGSNWINFGNVSAASALLLGSNTLVRFNPALNYNGSVSLTYRAWDQTTGTIGDHIDPGAGGDSTAFSTAIATSNLTINSVNDAPALTGTKATLSTGFEDTAYTINAADLLIGFSDVEGDALAVTNLGATNGTLSAYNATTRTWSFTPVANFNGTVNLNYTIGDGKGGNLAATQSFVVAPVNDAPILNPVNVRSFNPINEDPATNVGMLVANFLGSAVSDLDAGALRGIAITGLTGDSNGSWQYSNDGSNWISFGTVSATSALLLGGNALVRFNPGLNYNGSVGLTYRAWDQTSGIAGSQVDTSTTGGSTAFSTAIATSNLTINPVNDAPMNTAPTTQTVNEDMVLVFSQATGNAISVSDVDAGNNGIRVNLSITSGVLQLGNSTGLGSITGNGTANLTITGTLANLNTALDGLQFTPLANFNGSSTLTINTNDLGFSGNGGGLGDRDTIAITVNPINDAPVNTLPTTPLSVSQGSFLVFSNSNRISISDVDANNAIEQVTLSATYGSLDIGNISGLTTFAGNNTGNLSLQGTVAGLNAALSTLRFTPDAQATIAGVVNLAISTSDLGNTGSNGAQIDTDILSIAVNPANPLLGTINSDTLTGSNLSNFIQGFEGDDLINGNGGQDIFFGGAGNDIIRTGSGNDFIDGGLGSDTIYLSGGQDTIALAKGNGIDTIYGYSAGSTRFKLDAGLNYSELSIVQDGLHTLIQTSSETLALLDRTQANTLSFSSFM